MEKKLYNELIILRNRLKEEHSANGRRPIVCSDESIKEIVRLLPKDKNDLQSITGLGNVFITKYGDIFLSVLNEYHKAQLKNEELTDEVKNTLIRLEKRLINISKSNRLLYMAKIYNKFAFDLFYAKDKDFNSKLQDMILGKNKWIETYNLNGKDPNFSEQKSRYKKVSSLVRELSKDFRETGDFDLYIGYPFVNGKVIGDDFVVRAPLVLFPVEYTRVADSIKIRIDKSKDILYNNTLILLHNKINNINKDLPNNIVEEVGENFLSNTLKYFKENGINIQISEIENNFDKDENIDLDSILIKSENPTEEILSKESMLTENELKEIDKHYCVEDDNFVVNKNIDKDNYKEENNIEDLEMLEANSSEKTINIKDIPLQKFKEYTSKTFPKFKNGEFVLENSMVLGKFAQYSNFMQKDYKTMINSSEINELVNELLKGYNDLDIYNEKSNNESSDSKCNFKENEISYITDLNSSQENAIVQIATKDKLVIQGPPGTGKSQVIVSMIADAVSKGKNILMVSQKKAALDVIYSRLGYLSKYAMMIYDTKNKNNFYLQLLDLIQNTETNFEFKDKIFKLENDIDINLEKLEDIANKMFEENTHGTTMCKIYQENLDNTIKSQNSKNIMQWYQVIDKKLLNIKYDSLKNAFVKLSNKESCQILLRFLELEEKYPWLKDIKTSLDSYEKMSMMSNFDNFVANHNIFLKKSFLQKLFASLKEKSKLKKILKKYFNTKKYFKIMYKNYSEILNGLNLHTEYIKKSLTFNELDNDEKLYAQSLYSLSKNEKIIDNDLNKKMYDFIVHSFILDFEHKNISMFHNIEDFHNIASLISNNISSKKDITKNNLHIICKNIYSEYIVASKRYSDIKRLTESKRKWSVQKFIEKYDFELFKGIKVWLMTPEVVSEILPLDSNLFDLLIFDEASQIYIEKGIPSIARAKKVVIAGDHKQLRPSSLGVGRINFETDSLDDEEINAALEEESLLDLARFKYPEVLLNFHYRSRYEELISFSNYAFYNGKLNVSPNTQKLDSPPIEVYKVENAIWENRCNKKEAEVVVKLVKDHLFNRKNKETLGVITFNSSQRDLILDMIEDECVNDKDFGLICNKEFERKENGEDIGFFVKNIENVQGDERDYIIFSIAYAKNETGKVVRNYGWLNQIGGENRLNVAISRAKLKIVLVTSILPEELVVDDLQNDGPKIFKQYLEYCYAISSEREEDAKQILNSFVDNDILQTAKLEINDYIADVSKTLQDLGFVIETNVGIGGHKIDIAIKNSLNTGYLLGIECDSKLYDMSKIARDRDIHKQKYLEIRGWNIYRLWSHNWWHNSEIEIEKIKSICEKLDKNLKK